MLRIQSLTVQNSLTSAVPQQVSIWGLPLHLHGDAPSWLLATQAQHQSCHVITLNAEMIMLAQNVPELAEVIQQAELVIPDGSGVTFYLWLHGISSERQPGIELAESLLHKIATESPSLGVFFYGGGPGIAEEAAQYWQKTLANLKVLGTHCGYHGPDDEEQLKATLADLQPALILVALGVPRQEYWIAANRHLCPEAIWIGVGGSLDIWAGNKNRAPRWLRDNHLEWLYRLYQEPWRWRRMLALPKFAWRAVKSRFSWAHEVSP